MEKVLCSFDAEGREVLDTTPVEMPLNYRHPPSMAEMIRTAIRQEMSQQAAASGMESFEEADDFVVDEEDEFVSPYQLTEMQEEIPSGLRRKEHEYGKVGDTVGGGAQAGGGVGGVASGVVGASAGKAVAHPGDGGSVQTSTGGLSQAAGKV